jgi:hypothetical protein
MALSIVGGVCGLLIACDLVLGLLDGRLNHSVVTNQKQFGQAQLVQTTAQDLVLRLAQAGQAEPALRELLAKHDFKVNLNTDSQAKPSP